MRHLLHALAFLRVCLDLSGVAGTASLPARSTRMPPKVLGPDGIQMLYPSVHDDMSWYSATAWAANRFVAVSGSDVADPADGRSLLNGYGAANITNGLLTMAGSPTVSVTNAKYGWADVEVTVYARNPSGAYRGTYSGFTIQARSGGYSSSDQCSYRSYLAKLYLQTRQYGLQKQYLPTYYSSSFRTATSIVPSSAYVGSFLGMKLIVRNATNGSTVAVDMYVDYTEGAGGGTWQQVIGRVDANDWAANWNTQTAYPCNYSDNPAAYPGYLANFLAPGKTCTITMTDPVSDAQATEWKWFSIRNIGANARRPPMSSTTSPVAATTTTRTVSRRATGALVRSTTRQALAPATSAVLPAATATAPPPYALPVIGQVFKAYQVTVAARLGTTTYTTREASVDLPRDLANALALSTGLPAARFAGAHLNANADQSTITFWLLPTVSPSNLTEMSSVAVDLVNAFADPASSLYADLFLGRITSTIDPNVRARVTLVDLRQCALGVFGPASANPDTCVADQRTTTTATTSSSPGTNRPGPATSPAVMSTSFLGSSWTSIPMLLALSGSALALLFVVCLAAFCCRRRRRPWSSWRAPAPLLTSARPTMMPMHSLPAYVQAPQLPMLAYSLPSPSQQQQAPPSPFATLDTQAATSTSSGGNAPPATQQRPNARQTRRWRAATADQDTMDTVSSADDADTLAPVSAARRRRVPGRSPHGLVADDADATLTSDHDTMAT
ncbi:Uncharacterized protein PBTT_07352 [Plasmodiophora brassicae]|uniref:Uncharacterized protein n=1 Tax=Plasmodiophora brassicae TaxID=37360 RepID=A0A0G4J0Z4_PLABS|nr:hypothetical protein PBRA_008469 [Plasmodiophora brassicae]SPQ99439.1 unnamed protein product [Plasmodiophora brassicae]